MLGSVSTLQASPVIPSASLLCQSPCRISPFCLFGDKKKSCSCVGTSKWVSVKWGSVNRNGEGSVPLVPLVLVFFLCVCLSCDANLTSLRAVQEESIDLRLAFVCPVVQMFWRWRPCSRMSHERTGTINGLCAHTEAHCYRSSAASVRAFCPLRTLLRKRWPCLHPHAV